MGSAGTLSLIARGILFLPRCVAVGAAIALAVCPQPALSPLVVRMYASTASETSTSNPFTRQQLQCDLRVGTSDLFFCWHSEGTQKHQMLDVANSLDAVRCSDLDTGGGY
jgi:hypothetical protein